MKRVLLTALVLTLCLACAAFAAEEPKAPIWQNGVVFALQAIGFIITILLLRKWLFGPVSNLLEQRQAEIEENYAVSEAAKSQAEADKAEYTKRLLECDDEVKKIKNQAVKAAMDEAEATKQSANDYSQETRKAAEAERDRIIKEAEKEIQARAVELSFQISEKLIRSELDKNSGLAEKLADDFIRELDGSEK